MLKHYLIIFLISMVPLIELRGAIPYAVGFDLPLLPSYIICILGNMLPVPIIFLFARKVLEWGADKPVIGKFFTFCLEKGHKGGEKLQQKAGRGLFVALLLFVGIPVPGTGAWTGTLAASLLDMDFKSSVIAVLLGVVLAGVIMGLVSAGLFGAIGLAAEKVRQRESREPIGTDSQAQQGIDRGQIPDAERGTTWRMYIRTLPECMTNSWTTPLMGIGVKILPR